ncbi:response regulator [Dictyobacter formicarum]|uniref:Response regulatory domain-containing protein n=1 Tax=Dictyobacter formicarum TaxID=2778368 RepID=A0ABQ3V8T6_9CHLR|nr:response regulator [Dictyobacter formicarum]GHO82194.1 hypothetical protein KSZ_02000 [Dictyobacter formicarum]
MSRQGRVLIVDDEENWRSEPVVTLLRNGYFAQAAASADEALELLTKDLYHILILDIRLEDNDPENEDGLKLLQELQNRNLSKAVKIIMLSNNDRPEYMRTAFRNYGVADFLSKSNFNKKTLLESLEEVFTEKLKINLALDTIWQGNDDEENVVVNLAMNGTRVAKGTDLQQLMWRELDDLLCRLFYDAERVLIHPVTPGQSATGVLSVQPFTKAGAKNTVIVKFGSIDKIKQEQANFKEYIEHRIGGGRSTIVHDLRQTQHLGGIIYSFVGAANTSPEDFEQFYHHAERTTIKKAIDNLFHETCGNWYGDKNHLQPLNLTDDYQRLLRFTPERLEQGLQALSPLVQRGQRLHFQDLHEERTFTDPVRVTTSRRPLIYSTYTCITHGDLNSHNILLDKNDNTWLIDFLRTGQGHVLRDLSQLDSVVRFELLAGHEATLDERLRMEEALCSIEYFQQLKDLESRFSTNNAALDKAYATVLHVRDLAWNILGHKPYDHMNEYYAALLYHALNTLRFYDLSVVQREHALLCASLLADKLRLSV